MIEFVPIDDANSSAETYPARLEANAAGTAIQAVICCLCGQRITDGMSCEHLQLNITGGHAEVRYLVPRKVRLHRSGLGRSRGVIDRLNLEAE